MYAKSASRPVMSGYIFVHAKPVVLHFAAIPRPTNMHHNMLIKPDIQSLYLPNPESAGPGAI
jgi:hypothetical protein